MILTNDYEIKACLFMRNVDKLALTRGTFVIFVAPFCFEAQSALDAILRINLRLQERK